MSYNRQSEQMSVNSSSHRATVYTREGCHLCDKAVEQLERFGLTPKLVDIDADDELKSEYDQCVPVVEIDGKIRFRGVMNEVLLKRILRS